MMNKEQIIELIPALSEEDAGALSELWEEELLKEKELFSESVDLEKVKEEARNEALSLAREEFLEKQKKDALNDALIKANSKSTKALEALIDTDKISFSEGKITGLSEQIELLRAECGFLFFDAEEEKPKFTKGPTPFKGRADLSGLSYKERLKLYREMPEVYEKLVK